MTGAQNELRKGWPAVVAVFLGLALASPTIPMYGFAFFVAQISQDFGWPLATTSSGLAVFTVTMALGGPVGGRIIDRIGAYKVLLVSLPLTFLALASLTLVEGSKPLFYAIWAVVGFCAIGNNPIVWTRLLAQRFSRQRGMALGIASTGVAFYLLVITIAIRAAVEAWGWRTGLLFMCALPLVILLPAILVLLRPDAAPTNVASAGQAVEPGYTLKQALRSWRFALMLFVQICMAAVPGLITHLEPFYHRQQLSTAFIVTLTSAVGAALVVGRLLAGYLSDKVSTPALLAVSLGLTAAAAITFPTPGLSPYVLILCATAVGLAAGAEFQLGAFITAQYFGLRSYGVIFGIFYGLTLGLGGLWSALIGKLADMSDSYAESFQVLALFLAVGAVSLCFMGRPPRFDAASSDEETPTPINNMSAPVGAVAAE